MKKTIILSLLVSSLSLQADFFRFEMGAGIWSQSSSGSLQHKKDKYELDLADDLGVDNSQDFYLWVYLKHPIPIIPNARMEYTKTTLDGSSSETVFIYNGKDYLQGSKYNLGIEQIDAILYYNILDNLAWITVDLGLNIKYMKQSYQFANNDAVSDSLLIPLLYGRGRFEIPSTNLALEGNIKYFTYGDSMLGDIKVKVDYTFDTPILQPSIELGYRYEAIKTSHNDFSDLHNDTDIIMSGVYLGAMIRY